MEKLDVFLCRQIRLKIFNGMAGVKFRMHLNDRLQHNFIKHMQLSLSFISVLFQFYFRNSFKLVHQVLKLVYIKLYELLVLVIFNGFNAP